jgi:DNA-directed RNA polymerase specialized sigma24 family protein
MARPPSEYRQKVIDMFRRGMPARDIARELGKSVVSIHSMIDLARRAGQLPRPSREDTAIRRRIGQRLAFDRDVRGGRS